MPITRMRMRPWLEMQINSNQIPGLIWINKEEMIFQIPWKHAAKHGWDINKDACLFRSWAIHTGRYKAGEKEPDPKTWKANFRCAMNSLPDIEEVKDQSRNKGSSAVRVYRMLPPLTKNQRKERKSKSSRDAKCKAKKKSCGESSPDTFSDGLSSSTLPDDHSSYTAQGYIGQDLDIEQALTPALSPCAISSTLPEWRIPVEIVPDSTSDLYNFQVSPMPSTSEGWCFWGLACLPACLGPGRGLLGEKRCSELPELCGGVERRGKRCGFGVRETETSGQCFVLESLCRYPLGGVCVCVCVCEGAGGPFRAGTAG
uniref:Interferon regulatory factor 1 n=1 Tax=Sus scrofa TaxID=9823 RepID=A0A8D1CDM6_PIG